MASSTTTPEGVQERFKDSRRDLVAALFFGIAGVALLRAVYDPGFWRAWLEPEAHGPVIGRVQPASGEVRLKMLGSQLWRDLEAQEDVRPGDTVFTGETATAKLSIERFPEAQLAPNSLIVVEESKASAGPRAGALIRSFFGAASEGTIVDVERGGMRFALNEGKPAVQVRLRGRVFELRAQAGGGVTEVTRDSIAVLGAQGALQIQEIGREARTDLKAGQSAVLETDRANLRVQQEEFALATPLAGATLFSNPGQSVAFSWEGRSSQSLPAELVVEPIRSGSAPIRVEIPAGKTSAKIELPEGAFQWTLQWKGGRTPYRSFSHVSRALPSVQGPVEGAVFDAASGEEAEVPLTWAPVHAALRAEVDWRVSGAEKTRVFFGERAGTSLKAGPGSYEWRVRVLDPQGGASPWSEWRSLKVGSAEDRAAWSNPLLAAPPKAGIEILPTVEFSGGKGSTRIRSADDLKKVDVILAWKPIPGVEGYQVKVFKPGGLVWIEKSTPSARLRITVTSLKDTRYEYEVSARLKASGKVVRSDRVPVSIELSSPVPLLPVANAQVPVGHDLLMTWEKTSLTQYYRLQISQDAQFSELAADRSLVENFSGFVPSAKGTYYWRLRSMTEGRQSPWSAPRRFTVK